MSDNKDTDHAHAEHISNTHIVKIGIVTDDVEKTASAYEAIFGTTNNVEGSEDHQPVIIRKPYKLYKGEAITEVGMKVRNIFTSNFWFEIIQPLTENNPWSDWLHEHGTSVCFTSVSIENGFEHEIAVMNSNGFSQSYIEDKGYERYTYFDTGSDLGLLLEIKETK